MKLLKTIFNAEGHYLHQIWREGDIAVYDRRLSAEKEPHELELVLIKSLPDKLMPDGSLSLSHEKYPSASEWGRLGWSFPIRDKEWVLALAKSLHGISEGRAAFVRDALHRKWKEKHG